jgi:flagellar basal body-associated protein FliL
LFDVLKITSTSVAREGWVVSALIVVQIVLLAATIGAFAFMLSSLWATLRLTFVGVPESEPEEENEAQESADVRS